MSIKLKDGSEVTFDFYKVTNKEVRAFLENKERTDKEIFAMLSKVTGRPVKTWESLPWPEWREVSKQFWGLLFDPNGEGTSVSASTGVSNTESNPQG